MSSSSLNTIVQNPRPVPLADGSSAARGAAREPAADPKPARSSFVEAAAVAEALARVAPARTDLQFRVEPGEGRVIVSVIDAESGEVVRQVPSEEALRIARNLADRGSGVIDARA
jgi:flagellar protein FlaG